MRINSNLFKNISYSFTANITSMLISVLMIIFMPKILEVQDYSIWQLYAFYSSYLGFFHFGWLDGIYLRYGGYEFEKLNKLKFSNQLYSLFLFEVIITVILLSYIYFELADLLQKEILIFVSLLLLPVILYTFSSFILQITNRIKEYAKLILFERLTFVFFVALYLVCGFRSYIGLLYIDLFGKILAMLFGIYLIKGILVFNFTKFADIIAEIYENINVGSKLLFANIASMLILGIIRFGISQYWNVVTFGKISLALSIANFLMVFINAVSVVLFPALKRVADNELKIVYQKIDIVLTVILLGALALYYPLKYILNWWLPQYGDSLMYVSILFPICFFESKVVLLINTYLKTLRQEALLLKVNFVTVALSALLTYFCVVYLHNLQFTVFSILVLFLFKYSISKYFLMKKLQISDSFNELVLIFAFVAINSLQFNLFYSFGSYLFLFVMYLLFSKAKIKNCLHLFREDLA